MQRIFPLVGWLPAYDVHQFKKDALAGITVGTMLIPQGMAYALLAGLPPIVGLYASLVPLIIYPFFGTSKQLSVGPVAMDSLLVASGVSMLASPGSDDYLWLAILLALMVGVMQFLMGVFRLGFLVNFLSQPVINGFTSAAAIIIGLSQVKHLFSVEFQGSQQVHLVVYRLVEQLPNMHLLTLLIGIVCVILLSILKSWKPMWPVALIVMILSTVCVWLLELHNEGVKIVGNVPEGLPTFSVPRLDQATIIEMLPIAFTIALISFMEAIAVAKKFATKEGYTVSPNQELIALGIANTGAGLFGGYPVAGSFSRTAVNVHAGAQTSISSFFNALVIGLTLIVLTPLFYFMPKAVLAAIVIVAVKGLIDVKEFFKLYRLRRRDALTLLFAFSTTLMFGARTGVVMSALASVALILYRISYPNIAILGRMPGTQVFRNVKQNEELNELEGLIIFRIDASLYYANAGYLKDKIHQAIAERTNTKVLLIDGASVNEADTTATDAIFEIADELKSMDIELYFADLKKVVRGMFDKAGLYDKLGNDHFYIKKEDFIADWEVGVLQSKLEA
ncbi:MAG: SulP family inorganic anion transporter [Cyclobacteriaceae bacterium]